MARWEDALDAQMQLVGRLANDERERGNARAWLEAERDKGRNDARAYDIEQFPNRIAAAAFNADTYYVDGDMQSVWEASATGFNVEPLRPEDLLTPSGFLWLERPFAQTDVHGKRITTRAILWTPSRHEFERPPVPAEMEYPDGSLPDPVLVQDERRGRGLTIPVRQEVANGKKVFVTEGIDLLTFHNVGDRDDYEPVDDYGRLMVRPGLIVHFAFPWSYGLMQRGTPPDDDPTGPNDQFTVWQSLWRLMQQRLAVPTRVTPDRHTRRRFEKAGLTARDVTVIRLRRPETPPSGEHRDVEWSHRWIVGGHWRWQPYKEGYRQIWIAPYVKGPEGLPLRARKARVFELVR